MNPNGVWRYEPADPIGGACQALKFFGKLYEVEREVRDLPASERQAIGQDKSLPIADALHQWQTQQRQKVPDGRQQPEP